MLVFPLSKGSYESSREQRAFGVAGLKIAGKVEGNYNSKWISSADSWVHFLDY